MENITMKLSTIKVIRLLLFIVLLLNSPLHAQDHYAFTPIDCSDGLSGNRVRNIIQLRDGRIAMLMRSSASTMELLFNISIIIKVT